MRAAVYRGTGSAREVLRIEEVDRPAPGPGEVLVRVHASGVNPTDYKARSGAVPRPVDGFQVPHHDGAGVIEAVGAGVDPARAGERVWVWFAARREPLGDRGRMDRGALPPGRPPAGRRVVRAWARRWGCPR